MKIITWNINRFDGVWDWYEKKKDKDTIIKTLGYIGDKSLDLLIAIIAGGMKL